MIKVFVPILAAILTINAASSFFSAASSTMQKRVDRLDGLQSLPSNYTPPPTKPPTRDVGDGSSSR